VVETSDRAAIEDRRHSRYRQAKATKRGGMGVWKSELLVVPSKPGNSRHEDPVEGRGGRGDEPSEGNMARTPSLGTVSTKQARIAELAKQASSLRFTTLAHHIDERWLFEAFQRTRRNGATGVDGQTSADYATDLRDNLRRLLDRAKSGTYRAPPVRRAYIPKGTGDETRPIGIPTFEDKVLQRAVAMVLEPIYEQDFLDCSYGFRPGRSAHQALATLWRQLMAMGGGWVVEVDIRKFFDTLNHARLREFLQRRIRDGVLLRLLGKWLKAGVLEGDVWTTPDEGTPQGGVISPLLANVYLHYVLDDWFEREVKPRLSGQAFLIRYADDFVIGFAHESDARRVLEVLPKRFAKYGLTLHPTKTRLVPFQRPSKPPASAERGPRSGTFDLLGFTHCWGRTRRGGWAVQRRTSSSRFSRAIRKITQWCRRHRHLPLAEQHQALSQKLRGHDSYYGITGNIRALSRLRHVVRRVWRKWLARRRAAPLPWDHFCRMVQHLVLPPPRVVRSALTYP
jgi:RNA-directed DNA polymerase